MISGSILIITMKMNDIWARDKSEEEVKKEGRLRKKRTWIKIIVLVELPGPLLPYSFCKNQEAPLELMEIGLQYLLVNYFRNPFLQDDQ